MLACDDVAAHQAGATAARVLRPGVGLCPFWLKVKADAVTGMETAGVLGKGCREGLPLLSSRGMICCLRLFRLFEHCIYAPPIFICCQIMRASTYLMSAT